MALAIFQHLLLRDAERGHRAPRIDVQPDPGRQLTGVTPHARPVHEQPAVAVAGVEDEEVLCDVEVREQVVAELLVDHLDAVRHRILRSGELHRDAVEKDVAGGRSVSTGDDAGQRRLPSPVLPDQCDDLPGEDVQVDTTQHLVVTETLVHVPQLEAHQYTTPARNRTLA